MRFTSSILLVLIIGIGCNSNMEVLKYYQAEPEKDISFMGEKRGTYSAYIYDINSLPSEELLKNTSIKIWESSEESWDEYTVWLYLPDMDFSLSAYSAAEFDRNGLTEFVIFENSIIGTIWENTNQD